MRKKMTTLLIGCSILTCCWTTSLAVSFSDLTGGNWDWARTQIEEMSERGIIAGFPDGTFKPAESVTKLQSLLLISRILGVNEKENSDYVNMAVKVYEEDLQFYNISYKKEIAYLLYKNVIHTNELETYISDQNANTPLKRYEAAILLTKTMGSEEDVKNKVMTILPYDDADAIPAEAKSYVEYVKEQNIMQGMSATEFGPMVNVTRAQMAVMLYRVMERNIYTYDDGLVSSLDVDDNIIKVIDRTGNRTKTYTIHDGASLKLNGAPAGLSDFSVGIPVRITLREKDLYMIEGFMPQVDETAEGIVTGVVKSGTVKKITVKKEDDSKDAETYTVPDDTVIVYKGEIATIASINKDDIVKIYISGQKVVRIEAEGMSKVINGVVIEDIKADTDVIIEVKDGNGNIQQYEVLDNVTVLKNGKSSDLKSITIGDKANLTLVYDKVKKIEATSTKSTLEGTIEEIVISKNPSITIRKNDKSYTCPLPRDVQITINNEAGDIYSLKLGYSVKVTLESNTIVSMQVQKVDENQQVTGIVQMVNPSYYLINISTTDAITGNTISMQIFAKRTAKIINTSSSSTRSLSVSDIKVGDTITAFGSTDTGVFEASTIIILKSQ